MKENYRGKFLISKLIILLMSVIVYPVSFGPTCWVSSRITPYNQQLRPMRYFYAPLLWIAQRCPDSAQQVVADYGNAFSSYEIVQHTDYNRELFGTLQIYGCDSFAATLP